MVSQDLQKRYKRAREKARRFGLAAGECRRAAGLVFLLIQLAVEGSTKLPSTKTLTELLQGNRKTLSWETRDELAWYLRNFDLMLVHPKVRGSVKAVIQELEKDLEKQ